MPARDSRHGWTNPDYLATVVVVVATGVLIFHSALTQSEPAVGEILYVLMGVTVPMVVTHELARRWD